MENALYYFFSTIAQTLGGVAALLGAVVLFRLQAFGEQARRAAEYLYDHFDAEPLERNRMQHAWIGGDYAALLEASTRHSPDINHARYDQSRTALRSALENAKVLRRRFWKAMILTAFLVAAAIVLIPLVPTEWIKDSSHATIIIVFVVWLLACLFFYGRVLSAALARE